MNKVLNAHEILTSIRVSKIINYLIYRYIGTDVSNYAPELDYDTNFSHRADQLFNKIYLKAEKIRCEKANEFIDKANEALRLSYIAEIDLHNAKKNYFDQIDICIDRFVLRMKRKLTDEITKPMPTAYVVPSINTIHITLTLGPTPWDDEPLGSNEAGQVV